MNIQTGISFCRAVTAPLCALALVSLPVCAQWLHYPTPGIPRTADGKPNLFAPAPRTPGDKPDLSGLWRNTQASSGETDQAMHNIKPQPWAAELSKKRKDNLGSDSPNVLCLPSGPRGDLGVGKIFQTPRNLVMAFDDLTYRQVFLDGRPLPDDPNPSWMGYSVGHWEGDTLVIESAGFNDRSWLDDDGHPHTEALRLTERLRRPDFGHLEVVRTFVDPKALAAPWVVPMKFEYDADTEMIEYVCAENERDRGHLIGKASDEKKSAVKIAAAILNQYAGVYEYKPPNRPDDPVLAQISVEGHHLMLAVNGGAKEEISAESESKFFVDGAHVEFVKDAQGKIAYLSLQVVEGDFKLVRRN